MDINARLARQLHQLRNERGLSIEELSHRSGVSRAMISRIERAQSSPTATVLNNLSIGLGVALTELFGSQVGRQPRLQLRNPVVTRKGQPEWVDPVSGYRRRTLTPGTALATTGQSFRLCEMHFPPGARVVFENAGEKSARQQIWLLRGQLEIRAGTEFTVLRPGDCMAMTLDQTVTIHNTGCKEARYLAAFLQSA